jgi:hypothetical protein
MCPYIFRRKNIMALYTENEYLKCECGNDTFTEVEVFRIVKKPVKSTLTNTTVSMKEPIGKSMQCTTCKKIIANPLNK